MVNYYFGDDSISILEKYLNDWSCDGEVVFVISEKFLQSNLKYCKAISKFSIYYKIKIIVPKIFPANTKWVDLELELLLKEEVSVFVGIGGGSVLDATKALAFCYSNKVNVKSAMSTVDSVPRKNKLILIPTIAGSGAEVSIGSVMINDEDGLRINLKNKYISADLAVIDPSLALSCNCKDFMIGYFDIISHALETYVSHKSNEHVKIKSIFVLKMLLDNEYMLTPGEIKSQRIISYCSLLMGQNLVNSSTCLPHRFSYALPKEVQQKIKHAEAVSLFYPAWFVLLNNRRPDIIEEIDHLLSFSVISSVLKIREKLNLPMSFECLGVNLDKEFTNSLISNMNGELSNDPCYLSIDDLLFIMDITI